MREIREIRINPIVPSESVLVASARSARPKKEEKPPPRDRRDHVDACPFCLGNEHKTPPTILAYPCPKSWAIRIVENLYPVLDKSDGQPGFSLGLQHIIDGYGRHEVIIDHHRHGIAIHEMDPGHLALLFQAYRDRMEQLFRSDKLFRYVLVFKNFGLAAGGSIPHTHSQLIALPVIPNNVLMEVESSSRFYKKQHRCIFCSLIDEALTFEAKIYDRCSGVIRRQIELGQYVVERGKRFIAIKPFASRYEWEVHILPLLHQSDFCHASQEDLEDFARVTRRTMARLEAVLGGVQYNYFIHTLPHDHHSADCEASYHWHLEICPRTNIPTGFELGSGLFVNTVNPEQAAKILRQVALPGGIQRDRIV